MPQTIDNLSATWNNSLTTYTFFKANITDTASNAASLLMDLQVGGASNFKVSKGGQITTQTMRLNNFNFGTAGNALFFGANPSASIGWFATDAGSGVYQTVLTNRGAANLRFGAADAAAPVAQTLSVQSVVAGTTNTAGANLTITGSQGTGTGAGGSIIFQVAPAGSSGSAQNALSSALTITPVGGSSPLFIVPDYSKFVTNNLVFTENSGYFRASINGGAAPDFRIAAGGAFAFSSDANATGSPDVIIRRDAANTLALRNGANAQAFRSYRSFTDASNYSRLAMAWNTSTALVMAEGAGTGSDGSVAFNDAALATNTTVGFVMIPSCAGAPTGAPVDIPTGQIPMVWDSTNLKLYVYTGGAWKSSAAFA